MLNLRLTILKFHVSLLAALIPDVSKLLSLSALLGWMTPRHPLSIYRGIDEKRVVAIINQRLRRVWRMRGRSCLREGLLCFHFLRLNDVPAVLRFGVLCYPEQREVAHCWVTVDDRCVTEPPEQVYVVILTCPDDVESRSPWDRGRRIAS